MQIITRKWVTKLNLLKDTRLQRPESKSMISNSLSYHYNIHDTPCFWKIPTFLAITKYSLNECTMSNINQHNQSVAFSCFQGRDLVFPHRKYERKLSSLVLLDTDQNPDGQIQFDVVLSVLISHKRMSLCCLLIGPIHTAISSQYLESNVTNPWICWNPVRIMKEATQWSLQRTVK